MPTEVWFRNPANYIRELVECGEYNIAWDRGLLVKKRIDPLIHANLYFGQAYPWRVLLVGEQGTSEYRPGDTLEQPTAVYPTWQYGEEAELLEEIVALPVGKDPKICNDSRVTSDIRPVLGQEHRVVVINPPISSSGPGKQFLRYLKELQEEYPDCIIHIHGLYGWKVAFGMGYRAADIDPRTPAQKGKVTVPAGREMKYEAVQKHPQWCQVLGFKPVDLTVPRNRCMYNIKSAVWAGKNYEELVKFRTHRSSKDVQDFDTPDNDYLPAQAVSPLRRGVKPLAGDQVLCNTCSLQLDCKYFREGSVCSVPGAEPAPLARFFKTRDSDLIIDGLGTIMAAQTRRLERGMQEEEAFEELNPEVTKLLNSLFDQGVKLAKLVDPALRAGPKVGVFVGNGSAPAQSNDPRQFVAAVVRELRGRGIPESEITPELIQSTLAGMVSGDSKRQAIEGQVVNVDQPGK